jgi:plasmid rolling circle replication initiator protein Rep
MRCRNRLCPTCDSLNSLKTFAGIISALNLLSENQKFFALFLTLTQKNCLPDDLTAEIDKMIYAWNRLTKKIKVRILGYYRTLEVTCNQKTKTFHPHFHAILIVAPDYYLAGGWRYMSQSFIQKCWRKFMCLSYTPQVRIQAIQSASNKAICEVAKYTVKSSDVQNSEVLAELDTSLKSRRLHGCGGILKTAKSKSKADYDAEKVILLGNPDFIAELYRWDCFAEKFVLVKDERPTAEEAVTKIFAGA